MDVVCVCLEVTCTLHTRHTPLQNYADPDLSTFVFPQGTPESQAVADCNASCWGNSSCVAWDLIKVRRAAGGPGVIRVD